MNLEKLERKDLIARAKRSGIKWASRIASDELIKQLSAGSGGDGPDPGASAPEGVTSASAESADKDSSSPDKKPGVFGLDGTEGRGEPPAEGSSSKGASMAGDKSDGGSMPGSPSPDNNRDPDPPNEPDDQGPVYDAEVVVHDQLDTVDLIRIDDQKVVARLPLQGLIGRGRTPIVRQIRCDGELAGYRIRPGFTLQP